MAPECRSAVAATGIAQPFGNGEEGAIETNHGHPPDFLFHGTVERFLDLIFAEGLKPMARHHVHLAPDVATASAVGARRGEAVILKIAAGKMVADGHMFRLSGNQVWLADRVPPEYLERA